MSEENKDNVVEAQEVQEQTAEKPQEPMSHRDENWELVTFLNFSWSDADSVEGEDREYLLAKAEEVKLEVLRRRKLEMEEYERRKQGQQQELQMHQQQMAAQQQQQMQMQPQMMQQPMQQQQQWGMPPQQAAPPHPQQQEVPQTQS